MDIDQVGQYAMDNLRETIHENDALNKEADLIRRIVIEFFNSQLAIPV